MFILILIFSQILLIDYTSTQRLENFNESSHSSVDPMRNLLLFWSRLLQRMAQRRYPQDDELNFVINDADLAKWKRLLSQSSPRIREDSSSDGKLMLSTSPRSTVTSDVIDPDKSSSKFTEVAAEDVLITPISSTESKAEKLTVDTTILLQDIEQNRTEPKSNITKVSHEGFTLPAEKQRLTASTGNVGSTIKERTSTEQSLGETIKTESNDGTETTALFSTVQKESTASTINLLSEINDRVEVMSFTDPQRLIQISQPRENDSSQATKSIVSTLVPPLNATQIKCYSGSIDADAKDCVESLTIEDMVFLNNSIINEMFSEILKKYVRENLEIMEREQAEVERHLHVRVRSYAEVIEEQKQLLNILEWNETNSSGSIEQSPLQSSISAKINNTESSIYTRTIATAAPYAASSNTTNDILEAKIPVENNFEHAHATTILQDDTPTVATVTSTREHSTTVNASDCTSHERNATEGCSGTSHNLNTINMVADNTKDLRFARVGIPEAEEENMKQFSVHHQESTKTTQSTTAETTAVASQASSNVAGKRETTDEAIVEATTDTWLSNQLNSHANALTTSEDATKILTPVDSIVDGLGPLILPLLGYGNEAADRYSPYLQPRNDYSTDNSNPIVHLGSSIARRMYESLMRLDEANTRTNNRDNIVQLLAESPIFNKLIAANYYGDGTLPLNPDFTPVPNNLPNKRYRIPTYEISRNRDSNDLLPSVAPSNDKDYARRYAYRPFKTQQKISSMWLDRSIQSTVPSIDENLRLNSPYKRKIGNQHFSEMFAKGLASSLTRTLQIPVTSSEIQWKSNDKYQQDLSSNTKNIEKLYYQGKYQLSPRAEAITTISSTVGPQMHPKKIPGGAKSYQFEPERYLEKPIPQIILTTTRRPALRGADPGYYKGREHVESVFAPDSGLVLGSMQNELLSAQSLPFIIDQT